MKLLITIRHILELGLVCIFAVFIPLMPRRTVVFLARAAGTAAFNLSRFTRSVGLANLDLAYGDSLNQSQKDEILCESFRTFALVMFDYFWFGLFPRRRLAKWIKAEKSADYYFNSAPLIGCTAHLGNWEVLGQWLALKGKPCLSIYARSKNPFADVLVRRMRTVTGQKVVEKRGALKSILAELAAGGTVAFLPDQNVPPREGGQFVPLFGKPVPISKAPVAIAARSGAPIVFMFCLPEKDGSYRVFALPPVTVARDGGEEAAFVQTTKIMEDVIRQTPWAWMWAYKRWKYLPPGSDGSGYPFYARPMNQFESAGLKE